MKIAVETRKRKYVGERHKPHEYPEYGEFEGFTKVDEIDWSNWSYEFDITGVWRRDSDGTLWTADDSGCSCPTPWESTDELDRLFNLDELDKKYSEMFMTVGEHEWRKFRANVQKALDELSAS